MACNAGTSDRPAAYLVEERSLDGRHREPVATCRSRGASCSLLMRRTRERSQLPRADQERHRQLAQPSCVVPSKNAAPRHRSAAQAVTAPPAVGQPARLLDDPLLDDSPGRCRPARTSRARRLSQRRAAGLPRVSARRARSGRAATARPAPVGRARRVPAGVHLTMAGERPRGATHRAVPTPASGVLWTLGLAASASLWATLPGSIVRHVRTSRWHPARAAIRGGLSGQDSAIGMRTSRSAATSAARS